MLAISRHRRHEGALVEAGIWDLASPADDVDADDNTRDTRVVYLFPYE